MAAISAPTHTQFQTQVGRDPAHHAAVFGGRGLKCGDVGLAPVLLAQIAHAHQPPSRRRARRIGSVEFPIKVALAQAVPNLPDGPGWWFEPKKYRFSRVRANKNG
ncbi:hypothetical protein ACFU9B_40880 [Streptomyces sp. NPDC057592]|uniref:hypothetical protein n=1 Tax=unclassified Streptomyces TaxID=2593676 RepID=UPI0036AC0F83